MKKRQVLPLTEEILRLGVFRDSNIFLVDVGASGGIGHRWLNYGNELIAIGYEPDIAEVERCNKLSPSAKIRYVDAYVGSPFQSNLVAHSLVVPTGKDFTNFNNNINTYFRSSACYTARYNRKRNEAQNSNPPQMATRRVSLDTDLQDTPYPANFIKIDTDGYDYDVLLGARNLLSRNTLLGVEIECQFHGPVCTNSNIFSNIDLLLRENGFSLFDMDLKRYSRSTLPRSFLYRIAETTEGQLLWSQALYFRDYGDPDYEKKWSLEPTIKDVLKLATMLESYGLEDCASELFLKYRDKLEGTVDVEHCLNLLTPLMNYQKVTYREYVDTFEENPNVFLKPK
ncbi:MAG: FkbM family methyltransferase [Candidatus Electryonea clarkiae]|nr:FkbM family methyltransferase [Candidatus Electryonea clarkiae]MDP8285980.1 FkbM family methyltransferase [Candidatus Electryonea clarkiae]